MFRGQASSFFFLSIMGLLGRTRRAKHDAERKFPAAASIRVVDVTPRLVSRPSAGSIRAAAEFVVPHDASTVPTVPSGHDKGIVVRESPAATKANVGSHGRRRVSDLLNIHRDDVDALRVALQHDTLFDLKRHDDLWLLRFVLSHAAKGGVAAAAKAARGALRYRDDMGMDAPDYDATPEAKAAIKLFYDNIGAGGISFFAPDSERGVLLVAVTRLIDMPGIANATTRDQFLLAARCASEWLFRRCDETTRRTGYLTKYVRLVECDGMRFSQMSREFRARDAQSARLLEECYPQMLESIFLCHPPGWLLAVWRSLRAIMPERIVEKVDMISPSTNAAERARLLRYLAPEHVPAMFGGTGLVGPLPNARADVIDRSGSTYGSRVHLALAAAGKSFLAQEHKHNSLTVA